MHAPSAVKVENLRYIGTPILPTALDKLAQGRKAEWTESLQKLQKRAKSKYITRSLVVELLKLDSPLKGSYFQTLRCADEIVQTGTKFTAKYCKNRFCLVCNRIRTGTLVRGYLEPILALEDPHFTTCTMPTIAGEDLEERICQMNRAVRRIMDRLRKRGVKLTGIRKLECTPRPAFKFHPHFHFIFENSYQAFSFLSEWLVEFPEASPDAQDIRPADAMSVKELFKYFTKLLPTKVEAGQKIHAYQLDVIFRAMKGKQVYKPFGNIRKVSEDIEQIISEDLEGMKPKTAFYIWMQEIHDWFDIETAELLSYYKPTAKDKEFINLIAKTPTNAKVKNTCKG